MQTTQKKTRWLFIPLGMAMFVCLGTVYSWSVFRKPLEDLFQIGSTQSGLPYMLFLASYAFLMPAGGLLLERFSPRAVIMAGGAMVGLGWILSGFAWNITILSFTYGILAGGGVGLVYGVPLAVTARWFPDKKGLAVGLTLMGFGISPFVTAPVARMLIVHYGPMQAFQILGTVFLVTILLLALPFRYPKHLTSADSGKGSLHCDTDTGSMFQSSRFYGLWICFGISTMVGLMTIGITGSVGEEIIRLDSNRAAWFVAMFSVFNGIGRPLFGWLTDWLHPYRTAVITHSLMVLAAVLMLMAKEGSIIIYIISFSILWLTLGGWLAIAPTTTSILFGQKYYSKNYGFVFTAYGVGAILGVLTSGIIRDALGSYHYVFYPVLLLGIAGIIVSRLLIRQ